MTPILFRQERRRAHEQAAETVKKSDSFGGRVAGSGNGAKFARYRVREEDLPSLTKALRHVQAPETVIKERC